MLVRPAVEAGESLGFLPGDLQAKINPYLRPLMDALREMVDHDTIKRLTEQDVIEVIPLAYMRGRTLNDAFIILDEAQNTSVAQMKMFLTRMGNGSKIVVSGDITQVDLPPHTRSGLVDGLTRLRDIPRFAAVELTGRRHRPPPHGPGDRPGLRRAARQATLEERIPDGDGRSTKDAVGAGSGAGVAARADGTGRGPGLRRRNVLLRIGLCLATGRGPVRRDPRVAAAVQLPHRPGACRGTWWPGCAFKAVSPSKTAEARELARRRVPAVYVNNPQDLDERIESLKTVVAEVAAAKNFESLDPREWKDFEPHERRPGGVRLAAGAVREVQDVAGDRNLAGDKDLAGFGRAVDAAMAPFRSRGLLGKLAQRTSRGSAGRDRRLPARPARRPQPGEDRRRADRRRGRNPLGGFQRELKAPDARRAGLRVALEPHAPVLLDADLGRAGDHQGDRRGRWRPSRDVVVSYQSGQVLAEARAAARPPRTSRSCARVRGVRGQPALGREARPGHVRGGVDPGDVRARGGYLFHRQRRLLDQPEATGAGPGDDRADGRRCRSTRRPIRSRRN